MKRKNRMGRHSMSLDTCVGYEFIRYCFILLSLLTNRHAFILSIHFLYYYYVNLPFPKCRTPTVSFNSK